MNKNRRIAGLGTAGLAAIVVASLLLAGAAAAGQLREVVLEDGSVILAEVLAMKDGVYTLKSKAMGTIDIDESAIRAIRSPSAAGTAPAAVASQPRTDEAGSAGVQAMRKSMMGSVMSNPNLLGMIFALRNDPQVQRVLQDPEVMEKVMAGDMEGLKNDPAFRALMENPDIQSLAGELTD